VYLQFLEPTQTHAGALEFILDMLSGDVLVCVDGNARSTVWHELFTDDRSEIVVDFVNWKNLMVHYLAGYPPTFRNRGSTCLNITLVTNSVRVINWSVAHELTSSDHVVISFEVIAQNSMRPADSVVSFVKYNWSKMDWNEFRKTLRDQVEVRVVDLESPNVKTSTVTLTDV